MKSRPVIPVLLLICSISIINADQGVQTDWSGGPGVWGPVTIWWDEFYLEYEVEWSGSPGSIALLTPADHYVDSNYAAYHVHSEDLDGDGDMDVLGAAFDGNSISWWENTDGSGTSWTKHIVDNDFKFAACTYSADIDGDNDMDILGASYMLSYNITWWENLNGSGTSWSEHSVDADFHGAISVYSEDIDGDGDMDLLGAAHLDNMITWWENLNGLGTSWARHNVDDNFVWAGDVHSEDIDNDGYMDILGASVADNKITWWENTGGSTDWIEHIVDGDFTGARSVYSEDVDSDGDMDILGAAPDLDDITWWENLNGSGTSWTEHTVDGDFDGAFSAYSQDIDGDGDMDVLGVAQFADDITWWENLNGSGTSWTEHTVDGDFDRAISVYSMDINGDGNMDILGTAVDDSDITWWDITAYEPVGSFESSVLDTGNEPFWDYFDWTSDSPPGTSISFQVRASDDHTDLGAWSDTLTSPCLLTGILTDGDRYVQYRAILNTSNPDTTPILDDVTISWDLTGVGDDPQFTEYQLFGSEPNPASGYVSIGFAVPEISPVELAIYDLSGHLILAPAKGEYSPGVHQLQLDELAPGIYFCSMVAGEFTATQRFVVIK